MCEDSDSDLTDLDIEAKTWNKIEKDMKLIGFREGAAKGRELSLQEGFNLGYKDGLKLGEYLGTVKGIMGCESEIKVSPTEKSQFSEEAIAKLSNQACVLCSEQKTEETSSENISLRSFEDLITAQQRVNSEIMTALKDSDVKSYLEKG